MVARGISSSADEEQAEIETVVEALVRSPRLAHLLRYISEKYFRGEIDQLKEINIATEVFGRPAKLFNPTEDAIARVEAHRLRKRLKEYYSTEGKDHPIQISMPLGTYVPMFTHRKNIVEVRITPEPAETPAASLVFEPAAPPVPPMAVPYWTRQGKWLSAGVATVLIVAIVVIVVIVSLQRRQRAVVSESPSRAALGSPAQTASAVAAAQVPLRLLAGYSGAPVVDSSGATWEADGYFQGGRPLRRGLMFTARTDHPVVFQQWRSGEFSYRIPLQPGTYELHLYFVETGYGPGLEGSNNDDTFTVRINGQMVLSSFDIETDAMGPNIADERVFKNMHPGPDGNLDISFQGERGIPYLNAIAVLPGLPNKQLPIRLVTQASSMTDHEGNYWQPDNYYLDGRNSRPSYSVGGTPDLELFAAERYGHFSYAMPVDTRGQYTIILHFAELYFGPQSAGLGDVGSRVFNVMCNGVLLLDHFDIYKEAGSMQAISKTFYHLKPSAQGKLNLTFEPVVNNATVSGIEVLDESP